MIIKGMIVLYYRMVGLNLFFYAWGSKIIYLDIGNTLSIDYL